MIDTLVKLHRKNVPGLLALALVGGGCATNPMLEKAAAAYNTADKDPQVVARAPVELRHAKQTLRLARNADEVEELEHQAYLARQRVTIAEETARLRAARETLAEVESEHDALLVQARANRSEQVQQLAARYERQVEQAEARIQQLVAQIGELQAQETDRGLVLTLGDVLFESGSANMRDAGTRTISRLSDVLEEYPNRHLLIEGYTDSTGSDQYNQQLSRQRAEVVAEALINRGYNRRRIETRGYGELYPRASNDTAAGRQLNRRVEIIVSDEEGNFEGGATSRRASYM